MNRYNELKQIFNKRRYFKIVCGAGNEDPEEARKLSIIYALAGANCIDVSANADVVKSVVRGLQKAEELAPSLGKKIPVRPFINVSVGLKGDPHIRKVKIIKDVCIECGDCRNSCHQDAIDDQFIVHEYRCIGCGDCIEVCTTQAIESYDKRANLETVLPECLESGAEMLELHAVSIDDAAVMEDWKTLNSLVTNNYLSMCLDRSLLSNVHLIERIKQAYEITGERLTIQADGIPMSGSGDGYMGTLQAIAIAHVVQQSGIPVMLVASGGTNGYTGRLAKLCNIDIHGVAIGTFARKIVKQYINQAEFDENLELIGQAVAIAEKLIKDNFEI